MPDPLSVDSPRPELAAAVPFLTIAIPTYNRAEALDTTLAILVPQLDAAVRLVVIDNASTDDTRSVCRRHREAGVPLEIIRNPLNIGADANIMRGCEQAGEGYLWILPDDDLPDAKAIATIRSVIRVHPDVDYINFHTTLLDRSGIARRSERLVRSAEAFVEALDSFGNLLFLTAGVYRAGFVKAWIIQGHEAIVTCGPSIAMVLQAIGRGEASVLFTPASIATWGVFPTWDIQRVCRAVYRLIELLPAGAVRRRFALKLLADFPPRLWSSSDLRGILKAAADGEAALMAAQERYRIAAAYQSRSIPALMLVVALRGAAPLGALALISRLRNAHIARRRRR
ncbi:MAG: glycosyltransferase [Cyanobium sp.]